MPGSLSGCANIPRPSRRRKATTSSASSRAAGRAWCHYGFFVGATTDNTAHLAEYERLPGTPGIKVFMGSSTGPLLVGDDDELRRVLRNGRKRIPIHAEDEPRNKAVRAAYTGSDPRDHPHEASTLKLDSTKARLELGWTPRLSLEDALRMTTDWYQAYGRGDDPAVLSARQIADFLA